jgi:methylmalonyl-CoA decarboxylase
VKAFSAPVVAMVHVGAGLVACDLVLRDETSAFTITPAKIGLPYNAAGYRVDRLTYPLAMTNLA